MALRRKRDSAMIWPGFVDAVTTLLMVLMFVLTIFTVMQSVLRDTITTQSSELDSLTAQISGLADALGLERQKVSDLQGQVGSLTSELTDAQAKGDQQSALIATLTGQIAAKQGELSAAQTRITSFEAQVAGLLSERDAARGEISTLQAEAAKQLTEKQALDLALAKARTEIDAGAEAARLAAARREALEALIADLRTKTDASAADLKAAQTKITEAEATRLVDAAALTALRDKLKSSDAELTAMSLALEVQRKKAEETLTLLAAANTRAAQSATAGDTRAALLATAQQALTAEQAKSLEAARKTEVLNQQIAALRVQLGELQGLLDSSAALDSTNKVQIEALGSQLNAALAQVASEQKKRAELEAAERVRLEAENADLEKFRSEFFGQLSQLLAGRQGVRVVGDRFVFSSEVLFNPGSADLAPEGQAQIAEVVKILDEVAGKIPPGIDWIIRVDGHTDDVPLSGAGAFKDNWQLSQARALSVVRYMQDGLGFPPQRLAATGFGEYQPVAAGDTPQARAQNRRIELKLTER
ncbi:flagellar motor protein [Cypionkella aquatica]|uniref:Flagellar motor protein n=1 Tax=Cypionkella aquatica TaxID=1756042 RepID=A0AA37U2Z1_9RHOB|nr:peptidoglycan -binding protein [Cypionkella aquatica]GLS86409.1 flagellar motor protein [Cypionkella aquatica]